MNNQKGLTLIEMISVLIVLSIIAVIVTPNIFSSIKDYRSQLLQTQLDNVKEASKNWAADNIDKLVGCDESLLSNDKENMVCGALKVDIKELQEEGYLDDKLENPRDGGYLDSSNVFVLITSSYYKDKTGNLSSNYSYKYAVYEDLDDFQIKMAIKYAKDNKFTGTITTNTLKDKYIVSPIKTTSGTNVTIETKTIDITNDNEIYKATIK